MKECVSCQSWERGLALLLLARLVASTAELHRRTDEAEGERRAARLSAMLRVQVHKHASAAWSTCAWAGV